LEVTALVLGFTAFAAVGVLALVPDETAGGEVFLGVVGFAFLPEALPLFFACGSGWERRTPLCFSLGVSAISVVSL
jgi:hypothetical protein